MRTGSASALQLAECSELGVGGQLEYLNPRVVCVQ